MIRENLTIVLVVAFAFIYMATESYIALQFAIVLTCFAVVYRPNQINIVAHRDIFRRTVHPVELEVYLKDKPELVGALRYVCSLDADGFMHFGRIVIEARYKLDQEWLEKLSAQFVREKTDFLREKPSE